MDYETYKRLKALGSIVGTLPVVCANSDFGAPRPDWEAK